MKCQREQRREPTRTFLVERRVDAGVVSKAAGAHPQTLGCPRIAGGLIRASLISGSLSQESEHESAHFSAGQGHHLRAKFAAVIAEHRHADGLSGDTGSSDGGIASVSA